MPLYLDRHEINDGDPHFSADDVINAHRLDLDIQDEYDVRYLKALVDIERQRIFCLVEGPSMEACQEVHMKSHGMAAQKFIEVDEDLIESVFGHLELVSASDLVFGGSLRTIVFTDMEASTDLFQRLGDKRTVEVLREHDAIIREAISATSGREIKQTGDGLIACFSSVVRAADCAGRIQSAINERYDAERWPIRVRVGLSAGEPVAEGRDLFGIAVNLASRICAAADPGSILASRTVRELAMGKDLSWEDAGAHELRGFDEPQYLYRLVPTPA